MSSLNPFYTLRLNLLLTQYWINFFEKEKFGVIEYPISNNQLMENLFWTICVIACTEIEMLSFYGCLDSNDGII